MKSKHRNKTSLAFLLALSAFSGIHAQDRVSLSLQQCRDLALSNSEELQQSDLKLQQSRLDRQIARTAYFPKLEASATGAYVFPDMDIMGMDLRMRGMYMAGFTLTQPLYAGGQIMAGKHLSDIGGAVAQEQHRMTRMDVLAEAEKSYWTLLAVQSKVLMLEGYREQMDSLYSQIAVMVQNGLATDDALLQIEAERSNVSYQLKKVQNGADLCRLSLCRVTGLSYDTSFLLADTAIHVAEPVLSSAGVEARPELRLLEHQVDAAREQVKLTRAGMLPTVGLMAGYTYYGNIKLNSMVDAGNGVLMPYEQEFKDGLGAVMLSVKVPLFQWGANLKKVRKNKLDVRNAELDLQKNKRFLELDLQRAAHQVQDGYQLILAAESSLRHASEHLRVVRNRYQSSMALLSDLLDARAKLLQAKSNLIEAKTQYKIAELEYLRASGRLDS